MSVFNTWLITKLSETRGVNDTSFDGKENHPTISSELNKVIRYITKIEGEIEKMRLVSKISRIQYEDAMEKMDKVREKINDCIYKERSFVEACGIFTIENELVNRVMKLTVKCLLE